jgi:hypothetical protein
MVMATAVTVIALPSLWLMSRSGESGAPNVATAGVGLDAGRDDADAASSGASALPAPTNASSLGATEPPTTAVDVMGGGDGTYLAPPATSSTGGTVQIAVPTGPDETWFVGSATYRSTIASVDLCLVRDAPFGSVVTVTNRNNARSVRCRASVSPIGEVDDIVLHSDAFAELADPTDAPIPVEIDW